MYDRNNVDAAVHPLQYLTDARPNKAAISIDGVGAFDHLNKARIFEQLLGEPTVHQLILVV